ncbi:MULTISPECIES: DUF3789 domain-containing protein [Enterococcus]|uniref:DUF3789 domain-containing protein n=1 Tax=Enterococcus TaxID=1350 RepID=UPI00287FA3A4|nr:DUF3789 domain-containing protein [Enterococcus faecium]
MNILLGLLLFFSGSFIGVAIMAILQVGAQSERNIRRNIDSRLKQNGEDRTRFL